MADSLTPTNGSPEAAEEAGLRYVTDAAPSIRRRRAGRGFSYIGPDGRRAVLALLRQRLAADEAARKRG